MKTALYGRIVFGASAVLFGVIALMWHDAQTWQNLSRVWRLPLGAFIGSGLMIGQIAGGLGLPFPRTVRVASIILGVVYGLFSLVCLAGVAVAPGTFDEYDSFFEQFALLSGAIAVYAASDANTARTAALARAARLGLALSTISFTLAQIIYFHPTVNLVPTWIPPNQAFWATLTTIAFGLAAAAMLINRQARLAIGLMTTMLMIFGVVVWVPLLIAHPEAHLSWSEFALTMLIGGAAWMVAEVS
jgi:hypothetical protein